MNTLLGTLAFMALAMSVIGVGAAAIIYYTAHPSLTIVFGFAVFAGVIAVAAVKLADSGEEEKREYRFVRRRR